MSSTQFPPAATRYPLSFHKPAASCLSFSHSHPLFSITFSLFWQNRGVGIPSQKSSFGISGLQPLSSGPVCQQVTSSPDSRPGLPRVTAHASPVTSSSALCFHILTNPFSRDSIVRRSIQNPRGVGSARRVSTPHRASPYLAITYIQPLQFHAVTHSFAQRSPAIPSIFNRFRTLSIATGVYPRRWLPKSHFSVSERDVHAFRHSDIPIFPIRRR